jgi:uncharacterized protein with HEPN domain
MSGRLLVTYLEHIRRAATDANSFIEGMSKDDFLADKRTQNAVVMSLIVIGEAVIGEAAAKVMDPNPDFTVDYPNVAWRGMRGMRNRIAHGYFDIDFDVVWETVEAALPALLQHLPASPDANGNDNGGNHD